MMIVCKKCGKFVNMLAANAKYCHKCSAAMPHAPRNPVVVIHCATCGKPLKTSRTNQKFCSDNCRKEYHYTTVMKRKVCAFCGKEFETSTDKKKYCGRECYTEAKKVRDEFRKNGGKIEVS